MSVEAWNELNQLEEQLQLGEGIDLEAKKAQGRDGDGELPHDFWASYSAMANTEGGIILLGVRQTSDDRLVPLGLNKPEKVVKALWDNLNNRQQISANLLQDKDIRIEVLSGKRVIVVTVPRASRQQRPVFVGQNMFTGTYRRGHEGDYRCTEDMVRRMVAEAVNDTRDATILTGFDLSDLSADSLRAYRNLFASTKPTHPWLLEDDRGLLTKLGGWRRDRETGQEGLTQAGLLMFGDLRAILDAVDTYLVDYQERPKDSTSVRWIDRITTDGMWSGNLFDFYRRVRIKLTEDLKVPFHLVDGHQRIDETPIHVALREALVNTLIHADYTGRVGILVTKSPDGFYFRNPGELRLPLDQVKAGGTSDCRNRNLQKMFQMIGEGEQAGSGVSKILTAWRTQHWRAPLLQSTVGVAPGQAVTELKLPTASLVPPEIVADLERRYGLSFAALDDVERLALIIAELEGGVTHQRLREVSSDHSRDITIRLRKLKKRKLLALGADKVYRLIPPAQISLFQKDSPPLEVDTGAAAEVLRQGLGSYTGNIGSQHSDITSNIPGAGSQHTTSSGTTDDGNINASDESHLKRLAEAIRQRHRVPRTEMEDAILKLCDDRYLTLKELAELLGRTPDSLQNHYLGSMLRRNLLERRFPKPNHPDQAYRSRHTK